MIGATLRKISAAFLLVSIVAVFLTLYFMANDLSTLRVLARIDDMMVDSDGVHFNLELNFTYNGLRPLINFKAVLLLNNESFSSRALDLNKGTTIFVIPCKLGLSYIGRNVTASVGFSTSYANLIPIHVSLPAKSYIPIEVIAPASAVSSIDFNSSHAEVSCMIIALANIKLSGVAKLTSNGIEVAKTNIPPLKRESTQLLKWYVRFEDLEKLDAIEFYLDTPTGYIKIYEWRLKGG
ncbi:MAG: hypothetical protein NDF55_07875 [archaeon GB-1867-005]|nr:hypothetical protein [Candidatus Culexmicrobium cathedralense]